MVREVKTENFSPPSGGPLQITGTRQPPVFTTRLVGFERNTPFTNFVKWAQKNFLPFLSRIWDWFRFNILFIIFDEKEEKLKEMREANEVFIDLYSRHEITPQDSDIKKVKKGFQELIPEHQARIKQKMHEILKKCFPGKNAEAYQNKVEVIIKNRPFFQIEIQGQEGKTALILEALLALRVDLFDELN